jgi:hypothetical protein
MSYFIENVIADSVFAKSSLRAGSTAVNEACPTAKKPRASGEATDGVEAEPLQAMSPVTSEARKKARTVDVMVRY